MAAAGADATTAIVGQLLLLTGSLFVSESAQRPLSALASATY